VYQCEVDGKLVYSDNACVTDAKRVQIDPVPRDSLDNPEAAERHRQREALELEQRRLDLEAQRQQLEQARAEQELKRREFEQQKDLVDKAQGIGLGNGLRADLNERERRKREGAIEALKAINGVPDLQPRSPE
jgi:hypothetical protein